MNHEAGQERVKASSSLTYQDADEMRDWHDRATRLARFMLSDAVTHGSRNQRSSVGQR